MQAVLFSTLLLPPIGSKKTKREKSKAKEKMRPQTTDIHTAFGSDETN